MSQNRFFFNPFEFLRRFGRNKVQIFIFLSIQAMKMDVVLKPFLAPLILATQDLYNSLFLKTSEKSSKISQRIAETKEVKAALENFKKGARKVYKRAADKLGEDSVIFIELFGQGLNYFNHIKMENSYLIIGNLRDGVKKYVVELGADMQLLMDGCYTEFDNARLLQSGLASSIRGNKPLYDKFLDQMILQLDVNRLTISLDDNTNYAENYFYFDETVLYVPSHHKGKDKKVPLVVGVDPDSQIDSGASFGLGQKVSIYNPSDDDAYYFAARTADEIMPVSCLCIKKGETVVLTAEQLGCPINKYLIIGNRSIENLVVVKILIE
jgi:hypothetical protein